MILGMVKPKAVSKMTFQLKTGKTYFKRGKEKRGGSAYINTTTIK